jgi:hypothetical protein
MQLKYYCGFSLFEIAKMTAEERIFCLNWINERKKEEAGSNRDDSPLGGQIRKP